MDTILIYSVRSESLGSMSSKFVTDHMALTTIFIGFNS